MYKVKLIKDSVYGKAGDFMNPMDKSSYINLYKLGLIEDEHNLIENKTTKKPEKKEDVKVEKKDSKKTNNK